MNQVWSTAKDFYHLWDEGNAGGAAHRPQMEEQWTRSFIWLSPNSTSVHDPSSISWWDLRALRSTVVDVLRRSELLSNLEPFPRPGIGRTTGNYSVLGSTCPYVKESVVFSVFIRSEFLNDYTGPIMKRILCPVAKVSRFTDSGSSTQFNS